MTPNTLHKSERLYLRESIDELFKQGSSFMVFPYRITWLVKDDCDARESRVAVMTVAPKKRFKHAVDRNHVKRLTREAYRTQKHALIEAVEGQGKCLRVSFVYASNEQIDFRRTCSVIGKALNRLQKLVAHA